MDISGVSFTESGTGGAVRRFTTRTRTPNDTNRLGDGVGSAVWARGVGRSRSPLLDSEVKNVAMCSQESDSDALNLEDLAETLRGKTSRKTEEGGGGRRR